MENIKQEPKFCIGTSLSVEDYKRAIDIGMRSNNNYASSYAIPIGTPKSIERKGHNGAHQSHISKK